MTCLASFWFQHADLKIQSASASVDRRLWTPHRTVACVLEPLLIAVHLAPLAQVLVLHLLRS